MDQSHIVAAAGVHSDQGSATTERLSLAAQLKVELVRRISVGTYQPHSYLPSERKLAKDFRTSRTTMANSLGALERDGLVVRTRGRGTRVLPVSERPSQPVIALIHGELHPTARADSLRTLQGARDKLEGLGYRCALVFLQEVDAFHVQELIERFEAIVFVGDYPTGPELIELESRRYPFVAAKLEEDAEICAVWVDHEEQTHRAVRTFVSLGHQRIAFAGRDPSYAFYGRAREGYLAGLREARFPIDESLIAVCQKTDALSGYLATSSLLRVSDLPTAIVAARDSIAEGVCHAIEEAGRVVGRDVSVIGFDDTTWPEGRKFLTTFREPCYEMGAAAAEMLVERIVGGWKPPEKRRFETPFVLRRTAGPLIEREAQLVSS